MSDVTTPPDIPPEYLQRDDGATIAYHRTPGKSPGVVFLTGYMSDMTGTKAIRLEHFCRARELAYVRFDYFGHGESSGVFTDGTIGRWAGDAVAVLDRLTEGPQVLVGSSLGGWIMLLAALQRPGRIADRLRATDVKIGLIKTGEHRLSEPDDLERLCETLEALLRRL